jgi:opacity protein-like surface antigen
MKKIMALAAICASTLSIASAKVSHSPYMGIGFGASSMRADASVKKWLPTHLLGAALGTPAPIGDQAALLAGINGTQGNGQAARIASGQFDLAKQSFAGNFRAGWDVCLGMFTMGLELDYNFDSLSRTVNANATSLTQNVAALTPTTNANLIGGNLLAQIGAGVNNVGFVNSPNLTTTIKSNGAFGAAAILGYRLGDMGRIYARVGLEHRRFKISTPYTVLPFDATVNLAAGPIVPGAGVAGAFGTAYATVADLGIDRSKNSTAFAPGVGVDVNLNKKWTLGAEWRTALHRKVDLDSKKIVTVVAKDDVGGTQNKIKARVDTFLVTLRYKFM